MYRLSDVVYDPGFPTADIGAMLIWDAALELRGVNIGVRHSHFFSSVLLRY